MTKYLLRRRNRFGQYVHLETYDLEPTDYDIEFQFGPGEYSLLVAEEGQRGLRKLRDVSISWKIEYLGWKNGRWNGDEIEMMFGAGNYFELIGGQVNVWQRYPPEKLPKMTWEFLQDGAPVMKNVSVLFKVELPWIEW